MVRLCEVKGWTVPIWWMTGALIEGEHRYRLWRQWGPTEELANGGRVAFVMLNPSTADATKDDPTIRRCIGYAKAFGAGALDVVNLYAFRATNPTDLYAALDPVGPDNDAHIVEVARAAEVTICAWGAHPFARARSQRVKDLLVSARVKLRCLHKTKSGEPAHPLYLPAALRPIPLGERP